MLLAALSVRSLRAISLRMLWMQYSFGCWPAYRVALLHPSLAVRDAKKRSVTVRHEMTLERDFRVRYRQTGPSSIVPAGDPSIVSQPDIGPKVLWQTKYNFIMRTDSRMCE